MSTQLHLEPQQRRLIARLLEDEWRRLDDGVRILTPDQEEHATLMAHLLRVSETLNTFRVWSGAQAELEHLDDLVSRGVEDAVWGGESE